MNKAIVSGLSLLFVLGLLLPGYAAERVVVCEELYQEG